MQAIGRLPETQRLAVTLYFLDGLSYQEAAGLLDVPVSAIESRLHRARNQLKEELMDMVSDVLKEQGPDETFVEAVQQAMPVRVVEPVDRALPVGPEDTVLIYTDGAAVQVQGGEGNMLQVSGRKVLFGETEVEARQQSRQMQISAERRRDVWTNLPHLGERWCGTSKGGNGKPWAYYTSSRENWEGWKLLWQQEEVLAEFLPDLLQGEVAWKTTSAVGKSASASNLKPRCGSSISITNLRLSVCSAGSSTGAGGKVAIWSIKMPCRAWWVTWRAA